VTPYKGITKTSIVPLDKKESWCSVITG